MRQVLMVRAGSACLLFLAVFGTVVATTGSPPHMRAIDALSLFVGILGIAIFVGSVADTWRKWKALLAWFLTTMIVFDYLTALGVHKKGFGLAHLWESAWPWLLYLAGVTLLFGLAVIHGWLNMRLTRLLRWQRY